MARKQNSNITLHPEHGLNPSMVKCFFCGEDKNEIALLGYNENQEAPRYIVANYDPCEKCTTAWSKAVIFIEVESFVTIENSAPIGKDDHLNDVFPTGRLVGITEEATLHILGELPPNNKALLRGEIFKMLFNEALEKQEDKVGE